MKRIPNFLKITFETDSEPYTLVYELFQTPYIEGWINLWKTAYINNELDSWFVNSGPDDLSALIDQCNDLVRQIGTDFNILLPSIEKNNSQETLNYLHHAFELNLINYSGNQNFLKLNHLIHKIEKIFNDKQNGSLNFLSVIYPTDMTTSIPLLPEYKLYAVNSTGWGDLVLGYATTGKNWYDAIVDKDEDLIISNGVSNKKVIFPEFYTTFLYHTYPPQISHLYHVQSNASLYQKYNQLSESAKSKVPIGDLNEISFGKLILGHIEYNTFCKKENIDVKEFTLNIEFRRNFIKQWNQSKFSKFKKCTGIEVTNRFKIGIVES